MKRLPIVFASIAALTIVACSGGEDSPDPDGTASGSGPAPATTAGQSSTDYGNPSADELTLDAWVDQFCVAYAAWNGQIAVNDGVDPTTLELDARAARANRAAAETTSASSKFLDLLNELTPPVEMHDYQEMIFDRVERLLWDMEDYVEDPAESLDDIENLSIEFQVRVEYLRNSAIAFLDREVDQWKLFSPEDARAFTSALDANSACAPVPR